MDSSEGSHPSWVPTFILSLLLWGGVLFGMVMFGHHLANMMAAH